MLNSELNLTRRIGCEFEMAVPLVGTGNGQDVQQALANVLTANGLRAVARGYCHRPLPTGVQLAVEHDASVRGESQYRGVVWHSIEVKTKILNGIEDWESVAPKALAICRYMGARVNKSTGHHLNLDFPEVRQDPRVIRSLYNLVHKYEPVIYGLVAPSRRTGSYARPMPDRSRLLHGCKRIDCFKRALMHWDRRYGINFAHLWDVHPRVELRYHQGTLNVERARHWLRLWNRILEHSITRNCQAGKQVKNDRKGFDALRYTIGLRSNAGIYSKVSPELKETSKFILKRWRQFNEEGMPV